MIYDRIVFVLGMTSLLALVMLTPPAWAGGGGEGDTDEICVYPDGPHAGLECGPIGTCAAPCIVTTYLPNLARICKSGPNKGQVCVNDSFCAPSQCVLKFEASKPSTIQGILTLNVDDDETNLETGASCGAATVMLEVKKDGQDHLLSQTYTCIPEEDDVDIEFLRTESGLNDAVTDASLLDRLLFRRPDGGPDDILAFDQLAQALRDLFGTTGRPTVVGTPKKIEVVDHTDHESDALASVVRLKLEFRFVDQ